VHKSIVLLNVTAKVLFLFTLQQAQKGSRGINLLFFNLGARWEWVVDAKPWPLYPLERDLVPIVLETVSWQVQKILPPLGFNPRAVGERGIVCTLLVL